MSNQTPAELAELTISVLEVFPYELASPLVEDASRTEQVVLERAEGELFVARWSGEPPDMDAQREFRLAGDDAVYLLTATVAGYGPDEHTRLLRVTGLRRKRQRRATPRAEVRDLVLISDDGDVDAELVDVSAGGVAFVLDRPLEGPGVTVADVLRATAFVLPAIEIVDSRIADWRIALVDTVADNASSGAVVLGGSPTLLTSIDVRDLGVGLLVNGEVRETGRSRAVLGNPAVAVAWVANTLAAYGVGLDAGHVVMPGACTKMIPVAPGDVVRVEFDRLGPVSVAFG